MKSAELLVFCGTSFGMKNVCRTAAVLIGLVLIEIGLSSTAVAQCSTQADGSVVCSCSASSVNQAQCCSGYQAPPFCSPNCATCSNPTDPTCCDPAIRGYLCTCAGPMISATGPLSYYLLAVTYEPPGNLSTAQYLNGTSLGSQVMVQVTSAGGVVAQITSPGFQASASFLYGGITGQSFQMTLNGSWGPQVTSNTDLINHLNDKFWLWTNVEMTATHQDNNFTSSLYPPAGQLVNVLDVSVGELAGLVPLPSYKAAQLVNLTAADKAAILRANPFVASISGYINPNPTLDGNRFTFLKEHFQVNGPDNPSDPPSGTAIDTNTQNIHGYITGYMDQTQYSIQLGTSVSFITMASAYAGIQYQYTYQKTTQRTSGTITDAQGLLESKTTCWHQGIDLYWDSAFGTYLFYPTDPGNGLCFDLASMHVGMMEGIVKTTGLRQLNVLVTATMPDGTIWRTSSNKRGVFKFFGLPANAKQGVHVSVPEGLSLKILKFDGHAASREKGFHVSVQKNAVIVSGPNR